jgi:hypothetical protein
MAPKTRSADSPPLAPAETDDLNSQQSSLAPTPDTLALVLEQMALINARLDVQTADAAAAFDVADAHAAYTHVAQRRRDAQREPPRDDRPFGLPPTTSTTPSPRMTPL